MVQGWRYHQINHHAEIKKLNGILYMNDGDWVESCTALVESHEGVWQIIHWTKETDEISTHEKQQEWLKNVRKTEY